MRRMPLVLMYHGIDVVPPGQDPSNLFVPPEAFDAQVRRLKERHGYTLISEAQYLDALAGASMPERSCLLTFDDGYVSVLREAAPILRRYGAPAICYVSPGLLGRQPGPGEPAAKELLTADEVRELETYDVGIGCHSDRHESLRSCPEEQLLCATDGARKHLTEVTGNVPRTFAYPFGHHDAAARQAVVQAGYECAFATYDGGGRYAIARVDINATDTERSFDLKLNRIYPFARHYLGAVPQVRRAAHTLVGYAERAL